MKKTKLIISLLLMSQFSMAQNNSKWDNTSYSVWPTAFRVAEIPSSLDGKPQKLYFYFTKSKEPKPLIVSLHTWSGDYTQEDPLIKQIMGNNWNYIHPDFRGVNDKPEACGSKYVISDIDDAISFALTESNVDTNNIHILGTSGGGFATMLAYMKSKHNIRTFSSWVGISNLENWYYESLGRKNKYAKHIALATTGDTLTIDIEDAKARSPFFMKTPVEIRKQSKLFLYCGINDGYEGSVPVSQTIDFYNKVVLDFKNDEIQSLTPRKIRENLLRQRYLPGIKYNEKLGSREIIYKNSFQEKVFLCVFEGGHEMIVEAGLKEISGLLN